MRLEDGSHSIIIDLRDRIIFVIVALRTVHGQAKERLRRMLDRFVKPRRAIEEKVIASQKAGCAECVPIGRCDFVGRQHLDDHSVITLVFVQRFDDPVTPTPNMLLAVTQLRPEPEPIRVPPDVHPMAAPALAIVRAL